MWIWLRAWWARHTLLRCLVCGVLLEDLPALCPEHTHYYDHLPDADPSGWPV